MPMRIAFSGLLCLCAAAAAGAATEPRTLPAPPVAPPPASPITDHFALRATYYQPSISTDGRFDADTGALGTPFNGEQDLGLDDVANQGRIELLFRMRERHRLRADYFKLERFAGSRLTRDINFRNTTYRLGDFVETNFDWRMLGFTYSYSGWRSERLEFGLGLGLHLIEAETRAVVRARNIRESGSGVGVLPTIELDGTWRISRRWSVNGRAQYLKVNASGVDGTFGDYHLDAQYRWRRNVAFGLGYGSTRLDAIVTDADLPGQLDISASGPELFFRVSF